MSDLNSFLTGSHAYGTPNEKSDVDMVVLVTEKERNILLANTDTGGSKIMFGKLNLIILSKDVPAEVEQFLLWKKGTEDLIARRPVTRDFAIQYLDEIGVDSLYY